MSKLLGATLTTISAVINTRTGSRKTEFVKVTTAEDLEVFQRMFDVKEKVRLPLEYLNRGDVYFCKNPQNKIVGGFAVIKKGPFRALEQVPGKVRPPQKMRLEEVNGVWLEPTTCVHRRIRFWTFLVGTVLLAPGNGIVYAVDAKKRVLRETLFNRIREWTIYEGFVSNLEGMIADKQSEEAVEIALKSKLSAEIVRYVGTYFTDLVKHASQFDASQRVSFSLHRKTKAASMGPDSSDFPAAH